MATLNPSALRARGAAAAEHCRPECRLLVLIYCGVIALLALGSNGLHFLLDRHIVDTGGLSGIGMRSVLQTVQQMLSYINFFFSPFWTAGFLYAMLTMVRGRPPATGDLLEGFRRFGRVLGHMAFQLLVTELLAMAAVIFAFTLMSAEFVNELGPLMNDPAYLTAEGVLDPYKIPMEVMLPVLVTALALLAPVGIWLSYSFRMSLYLVMERPIGGVRACLESMQLMQGHKWQMFRLDLSFWWYHGLGLLISMVGCLDAILSALGIALPVDAMAMFFLTLTGYCVLQTGLYLWKKCEVDGVYLLAYEAIAYPEQ